MERIPIALFKRQSPISSVQKSPILGKIKFQKELMNQDTTIVRSELIELSD